jgi:multisubunit Na+/H+ antiporter MnhB subunit
LSSRDLHRGVALFIAFGLMMALIWARLGAPDLALAEAAIGAGLSGALLLAALRDGTTSGRDREDHAALPWRNLVNIGCLVLVGVLSWVLFDTLRTADATRLAAPIFSNLDQTGVSNPVTAVLLNFRAYDTMLEVAVLLVAVLGILALGPARSPFRPAGPVLEGLIRWLTPLLVVTAGYLLWTGAHAPGGAFQAGAVLAAAAVMWRIGGGGEQDLPTPIWMRLTLVAGLGAFLGIGMAAMMGGLSFLQYPDGWQGTLILLIEVAATLSIAATLALAYVGGRTANWDDGIGRKDSTKYQSGKEK